MYSRSYWKETLRVARDYGQPSLSLSLSHLCMYVYILHSRFEYMNIYIYIIVYICIYIYSNWLCYIHKWERQSERQRWLTVVEGNPKSPFSIANRPTCIGGHDSFRSIAPLPFDSYLIMLNTKRGSIKYHLLSLWFNSTWDWTLISRNIGEHFTHYANGPVYIYIYIYIMIIVYDIFMYSVYIEKERGTMISVRETEETLRLWEQ